MNENILKIYIYTDITHRIFKIKVRSFNFKSNTFNKIILVNFFAYIVSNFKT